MPPTAKVLPDVCVNAFALVRVKARVEVAFESTVKLPPIPLIFTDAKDELPVLMVFDPAAAVKVTTFDPAVKIPVFASEPPIAKFAVGSVVVPATKFTSPVVVAFASVIEKMPAF